MTYIWKIHDHYPESLIGEYDRKSGPDRFLLKKGQRLEAELGPWNFKFKGPISRLRKFDDLANNTLTPLVSPRLAEILATIANKEIQLIPTKIHARDGIIEDYQLVNVTAMLPVVNRELSEFKYIPGTEAILSFRKLTLVEGCMDKNNIARCAEYHSFLLVSKGLAEAISDANMLGLQLILPSEVK